MSLFDVLEEITLLEPITEHGVTPLPFQLVTLWGRTNEDEPTRGIARMRLLAPGGDQIGEPHEVQVDLTSFRRLRNRLTFAVFPIVRAGRYEFVVDVQDGIDFREVARVPFLLLVQVPPPQEQVPH